MSHDLCTTVCTHILCIYLPEYPTALQVLLLSYKEDSVLRIILFPEYKHHFHLNITHLSSREVELRLFNVLLRSVTNYFRTSFSFMLLLLENVSGCFRTKTYTDTAPSYV